MLFARKIWSFTILFYWYFSKSWSRNQKVKVKEFKFGVSENSGYMYSMVSKYLPNVT